MVWRGGAISVADDIFAACGGSIYDVTNPTAATFVDFIVDADSLSPEGLTAYVFGGKYFLAVANEVSGTTSLFSITPVPEPEAYAMLLAGLGLIGLAARRRRV